MDGFGEEAMTEAKQGANFTAATGALFGYWEKKGIGCSSVEKNTMGIVRLFEISYNYYNYKFSSLSIDVVKFLPLCYSLFF